MLVSLSAWLRVEAEIYRAGEEYRGCYSFYGKSLQEMLVLVVLDDSGKGSTRSRRSSSFRFFMTDLDTMMAPPTANRDVQFRTPS